MPTNEFTDIQSIHDFKSLVKYLRKGLNWPIDEETPTDDLTFEYRAAELGIDERLAVKVKEIKQLRPLTGNQPWGVFWIQFEQKQLPVVVMRRILSALVKKQRGRSGHQKTWDLPDLMFISSTGEGNERGISFAHFQEVDGNPQLRTFTWDVKETHLYYIKNVNLDALRWPTDNGRDANAWRSKWSEAFSLPHRYVPTTAEMLAKKMAQIARYIREAVKLIYKMEHAGGSLHQLHHNLKRDLISDLSEDDFADMYAQTVTYGLFAARATRSGDFSRTDATALIEHTNPFLRELLEQMMNQQSLDLDELGVTELTGLLSKVNMEAILQSFGRQKRGEDSVIHFYETFMREYDPEQKTKRGEFYTPDAVVSFIVRSVDYLLKTEFDCPDGLATSSANANGFKPVILDPATGTGTFLKYVIEVIWETFYGKNKRLSNADRRVKWNRFVRENVLPRIYAFELKMSPYTIAHMKVGLALQEKGFDFNDGERLQIYLSNALQPSHEVARVDTPALAHESEQASEVKNNASVTIVIGNPPYSYDSTNTGEWISRLIQDYYRIDGKPLKESNPKGLQDDYVKFLRFAEYLIGKQDMGIVSFITNHGYLDNPTFRGMRQHLMHSFTDIFVLDLHGNSTKKEVSPDGSKDENVFDIQTGVAISFLVKGRNKGQTANVHHANLYGARSNKYENLLLQSVKTIEWNQVQPTSPEYFFIPIEKGLSDEYKRGYLVTEIMPTNSLGLFTARDDLAIQWTEKQAVKTFLDFAKLKSDTARSKYELGEDSRDWQVELAQKDILSPKFDEQKIKPISYRPFDQRYTYFTGRSRGIICMPRPEVNQHLLRTNNLGLIFMRRSRDGGVSNFFVARNVVDKTILSSLDNANVAPLYIYPDTATRLDMFSALSPKTSGYYANFTLDFIATIKKNLKLEYLDVGVGDLRKTLGPENIFHYMYAVFHSPTYRSRYGEFLKRDFPRLPLTSNVELFRQLCGLGEELVALHLLEASVLNKPITKFKGKGDNVVAKGHPKYQDGVVLVNSSQGFEGVPEDVWEFHVGGYQVCNKWLKDRRGRELSAEDIAHYQKIVVALKETIRLMNEIDEVIEVHGGWPIK